MTRTTLTFNADNWTGDTLTAVVNGNKLTMNGETLELVHRPVSTDNYGGADYDFFMIDVMWEGHPLATLTKFRMDPRWEAEANGVNRTHADPMVLAGIMASNLI